LSLLATRQRGPSLEGRSAETGIPKWEYLWFVRPGLVAPLLLAIPLLLTGSARADQAGVLFDQGLAAMAAQKYDEACPKLAESFRLDPHPGGLFTLAECENKWGKLTAAYADYLRYTELVARLPPRERTRQDPRVKVALEQRTALERDMPHLVVSLDPTAPPASTVTLDGTTIALSVPPAPSPTDPGDHDVVLHSPDGRVQLEHVSLARGETRTVILSLPADAAAPSAPPPKDASETSGSTRATATYVVAGVGAAGIITGSVLGAVVFANKSSIDKGCPTPSTCDSAASASTGNSTRTLAAASTGTFIVGGAALGAAAVLWFTRPKSPSSPQAATVQVTPSLAPDGQRGFVLGAFGRW